MPKRQEGFARPVAQEKDRNVRAWLVFLCLVCFAVAFWKPVRRVFWNVRNRTAERAAMGVERVSDKFVAISFEGVSKTPDPSGRFVSLERFTEYIEALRSAGYNPISLRDVRDFYVLRRRLPRKAVLLTFENNHKSTFFDASPLLRKNHWRATMGVVTKTVRDWDKDSLLRPYLKTMALDATWDLACESDEGLSFVETGPFGSTAPFFAAPKWIGESNRCENVAEFRTRIEADHDRAMNEFTNGLAVVPDAFFFPAGNYGQYGSAGIAFRKANIEAVAARYPLAFLLGKQALNDAMTDPHRLNRLQVPPEWTAARLLRVLDLSWPVLADGSAAADPSIAPERWIADWGALESLGSHVQLSAVPSSDPRLDKDDATGGARAWIAGSNGFTEGMFDMRFFLERGEVHIYLRHAADDDYLRLAVSDGGRVSIGRCIPGNSPEILAEGGVDGVADGVEGFAEGCTEVVAHVVVEMEATEAVALHVAAAAVGHGHSECVADGDAAERYVVYVACCRAYSVDADGVHRAVKVEPHGGARLKQTHRQQRVAVERPAVAQVELQAVVQHIHRVRHLCPQVGADA